MPPGMAIHPPGIRDPSPLEFRSIPPGMPVIPPGSSILPPPLDFDRCRQPGLRGGLRAFDNTVQYCALELRSIPPGMSFHPPWNTDPSPQGCRSIPPGSGTGAVSPVSGAFGGSPFFFAQIHQAAIQFYLNFRSSLTPPGRGGVPSASRAGPPHRQLQQGQRGPCHASIYRRVSAHLRLTIALRLEIQCRGCRGVCILARAHWRLHLTRWHGQHLTMQTLGIFMGIATYSWWSHLVVTCHPRRTGKPKLSGHPLLKAGPGMYYRSHRPRRCRLYLAESP